MKLSDYENEKAIDLVADLLEPMTTILGDTEIKNLYSNAPKVETVKYILKNYKTEIIDIMAILEGKPREEYKCNIFTLPKVVLSLLEDKELIAFFTKSAQVESTLFGGATEITEANKK